MDSSEVSVDSSTESPAQRQARLRRERRAAKIQQEGQSRLDKITNASGRRAPAPEEPTPSKPAPVPAAARVPTQTIRPPAPSAADDPEEVDISQHYYSPASGSGTPAQRQAQDNAALQNFDPFASFGMNPPANNGADPQANQDPMMQMLQAMMGGAGGPDGFPGMGPGGSKDGGMPNLADMLGAMGGGGPQQQAQQAPSSAYIWRIVHALFSFTLAIYVALGSNFSGSAFARTHPPASSFSEAAEVHHQSVGQRLFYFFATMEVALQSSRYFLERGQLQTTGWLGQIAQILPPPYGGYVRMIGRYSIIYTTVVADTMVLVFVLGLIAWWKGGLD